MGYRKRYNELIEKLKKYVIDYYGERLVTLAIFGSVASETFKPDSDIDILIVSEGLLSGRIRRIREFDSNIENKLSDDLRILYEEGIYPRLSPIIKTPEEVWKGSPLFLDMTENVRILFDRDNFFQDYIQRLRKRLEELGAKKVYFKGGYYWELKPDYRFGDIIEL
jgi:predicted nucleotidyltransferase